MDGRSSSIALVQSSLIPQSFVLAETPPPPTNLHLDRVNRRANLPGLRLSFATDERITPVLFLLLNSSLPFIAPQCPSQRDRPRSEAENAHVGPTKSGSGSFAPRLARARFASMRRYAFSSLSLAALLTLACLYAAPASAAAPQTWTVTTLLDQIDTTPDCTSGTGSTCSLRDAVTLANMDSGDTVQFAPGMVGVIYLVPYTGWGNLPINTSMNIVGPGANLLTISASGYVDVFAIYASGGNVSISGLTLADAQGAVIDDDYAVNNLTVNGCTIAGLLSGSQGITSYTGSVTVIDSTIYGNSGGGISANGPLTVINSTITGNSTTNGSGGGIYVWGGPGNIIDSTITGNSAKYNGGIANVATVTLTNTIVAGNTTGGVANSGDCDGCGTQSANNFIGGVPQLGPLAWNGGPTQTIIPLYGSPVIGAGASSTTYTTDQRGFLRQTHGAVDMGAVQSNYLTVTTTTDSQDSSGCTATLCSLRDALDWAAGELGQQSFDIRFAPTVTGSIQLLNGMLPYIYAPNGGGINIIGPGASQLTIDGDGSSAVGSVFYCANNSLFAISGLTITGGNASGTSGSNGGAIDNASCNLTVSNSAITGNMAATSGGAIYNGGILAVTGSSISGNSASFEGGGIDNHGTALMVTGSTISGNTTTGSGGGIASYGGPVAVANSTVAGNSADSGGGIYNQTGSLALTSSTISGNSAAASGSGVDNSGGTLMAINSVVAGNTAGGTVNSGDCQNCGTQEQYNFIGGNPKLGSPQLNGVGATLETMIPLPGSPVINAGYSMLAQNQAPLLTPATNSDERGFPRATAEYEQWDLGAVQTNYTSIAFERQPGTSVVNRPVTPAPVVAVIETNTNTGATDGVNGIPVTLSFSGGSSELVNPNSLTVTTAGGAADFSTVAVNTVGTGYRFTVTAPILGSSAPLSNSFAVVAATTVAASNATAPTSATAQNVTLTATVTSPAGTVNEGTVAFQVSVNGANWIGTSTTGNVSNGTANVSYSIPGGTAAGDYMISAAYTDTGGSFENNTDNSHILMLGSVVAPVTFSLPAGTYNSAQSVTLSDSTAGATIYYTIDGSTPTISSTQYTGAISVSTTETIEAIAVLTGDTNSAVVSATYIINLTAAAPLFSPAAGSYTSTQTVTLSDTTPGAAIYYTANGSMPSTSSTLYSGAITVSASETIQAIAVATGNSNSSIASAAYNISLTAATPTFSVPTGNYTSTQSVSIADTTTGAAVYYTTNGSMPTTSSTPYSGAITVSSTETIQAIAVAAGYSNSAVAAAAYTINVPVTPTAAAPTFSVSSGNYTSTQSVAISDTTSGAAIYYTTNGSTPTTGSTQYNGAITVSTTETIQAIAVAAGYSNSAIASAAYAISATVEPTTAAPTFSVSSGNYTSSQSVTIADTTNGATIYYTTNGSTPTTGSTQYNGAITVSTTETIQAIAVAAGYSNSAVASAAYAISATVEPTTAAPIFSVSSGNYTSAQSVSITDTTSGATIYYTTNGSTPTTSSTQYSGAITVSSTETIQAIAVVAGDTNSPVAAAAYTISAAVTPAVATPTFSISSGNYTAAQSVSITDTTSGAAIYYTTDGSTPSTSSTLYRSSISVSSTEVIQAIAVAAGYSNSSTAAAAYTINIPVTPTADTPVFSVAPGSYASAQTVEILDSISGAAIYYTTDGSTPTTRSTLYTGAVTVSASETIQAIAASTGYANSSIASAAYTINTSGGSPTFNIAITPGTVTIASGQSGAILVSVTPQNGFTSAVTLTYSGLPAGLTCSFSPPTVTPSGTAASTSTMTVSITPATIAMRRDSIPVFPGATIAAALCFLGWRKRRSLQWMLLLIVMSVAGISLFTGCGSSGGVPAPTLTTGTSTVTVIATSGSGASQVQQTATFSLTVK
jgi:AraC-like DNA-binding protein